VWIGGDVNASNKIKVEGKGLTTIVGDVKASNTLSVDEGCDLIAEYVFFLIQSLRSLVVYKGKC
jgi:cytoskeletal protein CcmA (bactofilin family)